MALSSLGKNDVVEGVPLDKSVTPSLQPLALEDCPAANGHQGGISLLDIHMVVPAEEGDVFLQAWWNGTGQQHLSQLVHSKSLEGLDCDGRDRSMFHFALNLLYLLLIRVEIYYHTLKPDKSPVLGISIAIVL